MKNDPARLVEGALYDDLANYSLIAQGFSGSISIEDVRSHIKAQDDEIERLRKEIQVAAGHAAMHRGPAANRSCPQCLGLLRTIGRAAS